VLGRVCQSNTELLQQNIMSHSNFGRGRGFGPRGSRAINSFGRLRFLRPPFRHVGPPRPGHPGSFGMPWQPNMIFQPQLHGNLQFRPGGRRRRICSYDVRFPPPNRLSIPPDCEVTPSSSNNPQLEDNETCIVPQIPLLGSEEERQQKIAKTADRLKQKLSCFNSDEMTNIWTDDTLLPSVAENDCIESRTFEQSDLNLTHNDLKDIGKINFDNSKFDTQNMTDTSNVMEDTSINVISSENKSSVVEMTSNNEVTNVENLEHQENLPHDSSCIETEQWNSDEIIDDSHNLEQTDLQDTDINVENQLLESDVQSRCNISPVNVSQDQYDQQDISQELKINSKNLKEPDISKTSNLQNMQFSIVSTDQDVLQNNILRETELVTNLETQENSLNSHIYAKSLSNNNSTLSQPAPCNMPVLNNVGLDNRLSRIMENSFHSGPPRLSPHIEQELPIDFDPSTPPPILVKQDQPVNALPPLLIHDLPPLFNPTKPPPNMRVGLKLPHENPTPTWNINTQNQVPVVYNTEVHMDLNTHVGFTPQQLPLEMTSQNNVFLAPPIDPMNFSPLFPMPPSNHPIINTNVPLLPQGQIVPQDICISPSSPEESLSFSDCNVNKDDVLNEMQEAMKFAQQMTNITENIIENVTENLTENIIEKDDEKSKSDSSFENCISVNPVNNVEFISLPPGKPKLKPVKLKRIKQDDMHRKKFELPEEQKTSDNLLSDEIIIRDDANIKFKDVSTVNEQDRPKVIFNLNNKTIKVNNKTMWQDTRGRKREKKNCMRQPAKSEITRTTSSIIRKNLINTSKRKEEKKNFKKNERSINKGIRVISSETIPSSQTTSFHKKIQRIHKEKSQRSNVSSYLRSNVHKSKDVEKNENSNTEISWKNNVINRFLRMSRNDIYNMVNNTSLRKFDVIMKRLVKEQKATLSLEMRHVQDEKMKLYDQQEFMKQLNAMLDTDATVSITDLPTEFIHHLNEVLQLDVQSDNQDESAASLASQSNHLEDTSHVLDSLAIAEKETVMMNIVNEEDVRNRSHIKSTHDKNMQTYNRINDFNIKDDTCSTVISNKSSISSKLSALQHDLDDIFSEVTKKNHAPVATMRKDCIIGQRSAKRLDNDASLKNMQKEAFLEDDRARRSENCARWIEKCDKWKKKEREDPYTYRNLTKEEWEAKYGTQTSANAISSFSAIASSFVTPSIVTSSSTIISPVTASFSTKIIDTCNTNLPNKPQDENFYPRRRHSSESSKHSSTRYRSMEKEKYKRSRRHSDDRKHDVEYPEDNDNSSGSSTSNTSSDSSDSDREPNVTKLLRAIKENEKVAKKMSLNEAIRDEVNAEIERERRQKSKKSRKNRKNAKRKAKRARHRKKKKQSKKMSTSSDSSSDKDNNEETTRLLTETEIKKEIVEDLIQQEVIIKEELDIGQEENIEDTVFTNISDRMESYNNLASPLVQETLLTASTIRSHNEDKRSTASPTQPKTKAQLKQMPANMNDNKVSLNIFTTIPESLITGDISENLRKVPEEINRDQNITKVSLAINNFTNQNDATNNIIQASHVRLNENTIPQMDATVHCPTDLSSVNIQDEMTASPKVSLISNASIANNIIQKQGTSKKIDIKTYYERTIQRRMNEQGGSKKSMENSAASKQDSLFVQKSTEMETVINKSTSKSAHDNSVQNPLNSLAKLATDSTNNKDNVIQTVLGKNIQKEQEQVKGSKLAEKILDPLKEDSNRIKNDNNVKKIDQNKSEKKATLITKTNVDALSNTKRSKTISKFKKHSEIETNITEQKTEQTKIPLDPNKFKNIRSEGSKELKLKKEMTKTLKARKKSVLAVLKSDLDKSNVLKKKSYLENTKRTEDVEKIKCIEHKDTEETASDNAREGLFSKTNVTTLNVTSNATAVEIENKKNQDQAKEISNNLSKLDVSTSSKIIPEIKASDDNEYNNEDFLISNQIRSSNENKDAELSLNLENQVRKLDSKDLKESMNVPASIAERDVSSIPESDISRSDNVDTQGKDVHLLINTYTINNIEINDTNENNMESDILANTYTSANAEKGDSVLKKTIELSTTSNKNCKKQQGIVEAVISPDSIGSPFKGFLQEPIMAFEQPNLFNLELNEIDGGKKIKLLLDDCNVNYVRHVPCVNDATHDTYKEIEIGKEHYEILDSVTDYANDMNINANQSLDIVFTSSLFTLDKEPAVNEKSDESKEGQSSDEAITILRDENNDIGSGVEEQLENEKNYALNTELTIKESMFIINEEEIIQDETQPKDLTDKLTTTTDPYLRSLSDAVDTAISDDPLRLPDSQSTDNLNNHVYLETNLSTEKTSCDKLPDFESEHLVNDMFYLDDRLQDPSEFDNKDDVPSHFTSIHQQSPQYDITPTVISEVTMITSDTDLPHGEIQKSQQCEFNFKHISSVDNDCNFTKTSAEHSPLRVDSRRTLNIPTKAALKEAAADLFLKSSDDILTAADATTQILEKSQQNEADLNYQTSWHSDVHHDEDDVPKSHNNVTITQDSINVNTISSTQNNISGHSYEVSVDKSLTSVDIEKHSYNIQRNPVVELQKIKGLDSMLKKRMLKNSEKLENSNYKEQKKRKHTILHKIKHKQSTKYRSKNENLVKELKKMKQSGNFSGNTKEAILAKMLKIDIEMHKLMMEKLKLYKALQNSSSIENSVISSIVSETKNDNPVSVQHLTSPILTSELIQNIEMNHKQDKYIPSSKRSLMKQKKRMISPNLEDDEIVPYTQRSKTPLIKWKKKPRLELTAKEKRKENGEGEKEDIEKTTKQTSIPSVNEKTDSLINAFENITQEDEEVNSNAIITQNDTQEEEMDADINKKFDSGTDKHMICLNKSAEKNIENLESHQNSTEIGGEYADDFNINKKDNISIPSETIKVNFQPRSIQIHSTPEPLSIYSDDSTWDSLVQNTASEMHENRKSTGLALLDEALKKEQAMTKKMKAIARKKKKKQLSNFLKTVDNLTLEEEELPLSKLLIKKLQQKRDLLDSLSQRKEDLNIADPKILKNVDEVINAVAENRVKDLYEHQLEVQANDIPTTSNVSIAENRIEDLYEHQLEVRVTNDVPTTSNVSISSQSDKHQFYVDVEANANADWACQEKEDINQVILQQDSNDIFVADVSNHVFKAVSQNKVSFYDENNVEPDSSVTPEETSIENHPLDLERINSKDPNNATSRNFDIKVSVPKALIKNDFNLELLQKFKNTEVNIAGTALVDSTTNTFSTNTEKPEENDENLRCDLQTKSLVEKDEDQIENTTKLIEKDKSAIDIGDDNQNISEQKLKTTEKIIDNVENAELDTIKPEYFDITGSEDSSNSIGSNQYDKITDIAHDSNASNSIIEKIDTKERKSDAESEQSSNDTIVSRQNYQNKENISITEEEKSNNKNMFEESLNKDQNTDNTVLADRTSEKSEESNETSITRKSDLENISISTFSFNKIIEKGEETSKKLRRKSDKLTPIRRSTRYINDNIKSKMNEMDTNSNSSEQESNEKDLIIRHGSKSPTELLHERNINNRLIQKEQNTNIRKLFIDVESETRIENSVKPCFTAIEESTVSKDTIIAKKRKHTLWQMMYCKVRVIDCKYTLLKPDVHPEVLNKLGIIAINPCLSNNATYIQHVANDKDIVTAAANLEKSSSSSDKSCDKDKTEIEILEEKSIKKNNDNDLIQESTSHVIEVNEEEPIRTQYTVHKGPILDIKVII